MDSEGTPPAAQELQPGPPWSPSNDAQTLSLEDDPDAVPYPTISATESPTSLTGRVKGSIMATEQVLRNQDLVDLVVAYYGDGFEETERYPHWRKMSVLSRTFFESCSDNIWKEMSSLPPLLRLLPEDALHKTILMRPLNPDDFVRWRIYSCRVREFKIGSCDGTYPSVQVLAMLIAFQVATGEVLFPALQHLHCEEEIEAVELTCLSLLASPSVQALHLTGSKTSAASHTLQSALQHAVRVVPTLSMLSVQTTNPPSSLWSILASFPALHTLNLKLPNNARFVEAFASFPPLKQGTLILLAKTPKGCFDPSGRNVRGSVLIERNRLLGMVVSLTGQLDVVVSSVSAATRHGVNFLDINCTEGLLPSKGWKELVDVVSTSSRSATHISLAGSGSGQSGIIPLEALSQLMALDNLRRLIVKVDCHIQSTPDGPDQLFHRLCLASKFKATPLTTLRMCRLSGERLGLAALQHVCNHLPHLLELEISIDSSIPNDPAQPTPTPLPNTTQRHALRYLYLRDQRSWALRFKECRTTAMLFSQLFPDLSSLVVTVLAVTEDSPSIKEGWELIDELRKDYQRLGKTTVPGNRTT
ncbi:hypothetical protein BKA70DRAFT_1405324 [Coprinopsis sp. MPI-PUGE-AT-0042]|nr:hypothetical protein BKA70DRAFT_1405324 [Coprinopsis sp. MPI-PUGE-AT-0042]